MSTVGAERGAIASVVQDALTGEILWVGFIDTAERAAIAESGQLRDVGGAIGPPLAVRHLSNNGDGIVILVEGPATRRQMDSILPEPTGSHCGAGSSRLSIARTDRGESASALARLTASIATKDADLAERVAAFQWATDELGPEGIAEHAAEVLRSLIHSLKRVNVPLAKALEAYDRWPET